MKNTNILKPGFLLTALLALILSLQTAVAQDELTAPANEVTTTVSNDIIIWADETGTAPHPIPAPEFNSMNPNLVQTANIQVNFVDAATTWDLNPQAKAAFLFAVDIWSQLISSSTPIVIDAYWENLSIIHPSILGAAGTTTISSNNINFPLANTWYPASMANALAGYDLNGPTAEIRARFNSHQTDWYFGTDLNTPIDKFNFSTVVLHEIGHGLGFFGSMRYDDGFDSVECRGIAGEGCWGYVSSGNNIYPVVYDRFVEDLSGISVLNSGNPSVALGTNLTSNSLFFDGPNSRIVNGGGTTKIYAPFPWSTGSSFSHLDVTYNSTINSLMTYSLARGETNYNPGPLTLAMLHDLGWNTTPLAAQLEQLPSQILLVDTSENDAIDVSDYVILGTYGEDNLTYTMTDRGAIEAGITFSAPTVSINPDPGWTGRTTATVEMTDELNQPDTSSFTVVVADEIFYVYLPAIQK